MEHIIVSRNTVSILKPDNPPHRCRQNRGLATIWKRPWKLPVTLSNSTSFHKDYTKQLINMNIPNIDDSILFFHKICG